MSLSSTIIAELENKKAESCKLAIRIISRVLSHLNEVSSDEICGGDIGSYMVSLHESQGSQIIFTIQEREIFLKERDREGNNILKLQENAKSLTHPNSSAPSSKILTNKTALEQSLYYVDKRVASLFHHFRDNCEALVNDFFNKYDDFNNFDYQKINRLFTLRFEVRPERVFKENKVKNAFEILNALKGEDLGRLSILNAPLKFKGVRSKYIHVTHQVISSEEADINNMLLSFMAHPSYESVTIEDINVLMLSLETFPDKFNVEEVETVLLKMFKNNANHYPSILNVFLSFRQIYGSKVSNPQILEELKKLDVPPFYVYEQQGNLVSLKMVDNYWIPRSDIYSSNNGKVVKIKIESNEIVSFYQFLFMVLRDVSNRKFVKNAGVQNILMDNTINLSALNGGVDFFVSLGDGISVEKLQEVLEVCLNAVGSWSRKKPVSKMTGKFFKSGGLLSSEALAYYEASLAKHNLDLLLNAVQVIAGVGDIDEIPCDEMKL